MSGAPVQQRLGDYLDTSTTAPLFLCGGAAEVLAALPDATFDCCMTSPPYWRQRTYEAGGIGAEEHWRAYIDDLVEVFAQVRRVLRTTGSLWLNLGDVYEKKGLLGLPWRLALRLVDEQGWVLRNTVIWHKVKGGPDSARDRLRNVHEPLFHLVRRRNGYHYDADAIRSAPRKARVEKGAVVSATGVSGVRYRRQIELSTALSEAEKHAAVSALDGMLRQVSLGELSDFRMIIRGQQRSTHSDSTAVSGRARELQEKGFYILRYHPRGAKPGDVWEILPEDTHHRGRHFAPFPQDLCRMPILATCPEAGLVLDPFCGTGTTNLVAATLGRKSVGIDLSDAYLTMAAERLQRRDR
jgi:DNA modification methylase